MSAASAFAEEICDIIPSHDLWGMSKDEVKSTLYECDECIVGDNEALVVHDHTINFYDMDTYYVFGKDMGVYHGLSKIAYILSDETLSKDDRKECREALVSSITGTLGAPDSETNAVTTWQTETEKTEIGTGKFKNFKGTDNPTVGVLFTGLHVKKKAEAEEEPAIAEHEATKLTSFYLNLNSDRTITLKAFEVHDEECFIPSHYTVDGNKYTVVYIDDACFFGRSSLKTLSLPEGVKTIAGNAFNSCAVKTMYFPKSLKDISGIFEYIDRKVTIYYAGSPKQWRKIKGSSDFPSNVKVVCDRPAVKVVDKTNYSSASLTLERSRAEELGSAAGNAINGIFLGLLGDDE